MIKNSNYNVTNLYIYFFISLLIFPLGFLTRLLYSRTISVELVGIIFSLVSIFSLLFIFSNFGFSASLKILIPKYLVKKDYKKITNLFYYSIFSNLIFTIMISIIVFLFSDWLIINYFKNENYRTFLYIFLLYFISLNIFKLFLDLLISFGFNIMNQVINFLNFFLIFSISLFFFLTLEVNLAIYYALSWFIANLLALSILFIFIYKKFKFLRTFPTWNFILYKNYFKSSFSLFVNAIGINLLLQTDILIIIHFLNATEVAYYSNAVAIVSFLVAFFSIFNSILIPLFSKSSEIGDFKLLKKITSLNYILTIFLILPISIIIFIFSKQIMTIIYGIEYTSGAKILSILIIFSVLKVLYAYNITLFNGLNLTKKMISIVFPIIFLNLILNLILVKFYGLVGVAFVTIFSWFILEFLSLTIIKKEIGLRFELKKYFFIFLNGFFFYLFLSFLKKNISLTFGYLNFIFFILLSILFYLIIGYIFKIYSINELYLLIPDSKLKDKLKKIHNKYFNYLK